LVPIYFGAGLGDDDERIQMLAGEKKLGRAHPGGGRSRIFFPGVPLAEAPGLAGRSRDILAPVGGCSFMAAFLMAARAMSEI